MNFAHHYLFLICSYLGVEKKRQAACKPGSVPFRGMTIPLGRPLPDASSNLPR